MMKINVQQTLGYLIEAVLEVFSPDHDDYPATGIQPFSGEVRPDNHFY